MFKDADVVMLPTKANNYEFVKRTNFNIYTSPKKIKEGDLSLGFAAVRKYWEPQHLYFLSNEILKKGDYFIFNNEIIQLTENNIEKFIIDLPEYKKIVATTDKSLKVKRFQSGVFKELEYSLPKPSEGFMKVYINDHNSGNPITKVSIECEEQRLKGNDGYGGEMFLDEWEYTLKVSPKDNTITIRKIKSTYTQEEVDELLDKNTCQITAQVLQKFKDHKSKNEVETILNSFANHHGIFRLKDSIQQWIKDNL